MNVIPAIDLRDGQCVRLYQGQFDRQTDYAIDPAALARSYSNMGFSDLHVVDLDGARFGEQNNKDIILGILETEDLNLQLGGGIRTAPQLQFWFDSGISRVVIGTKAVTEPETVREWLIEFGADRIVLAFDANIDADGVPRLATHGWTRSAKTTLWQCIDDYLAAGLRHVLCTDIGRDGALSGPNVELYANVIGRYPGLQLQASGGVRRIDDLVELRRIGMPAAICGRALLDGRITAKEVRQCLPAA